MMGPDGLPGTADDVLVEGNPAAPVEPRRSRCAPATRSSNDIAHNADAGVQRPGGSAPDGRRPDRRRHASQPADAYDDELLDAHYIAGDGRVNENIGLTAVHHVFHAEHNRLVEHTKDVVLATRRAAICVPQPMAAARTASATFPARRCRRSAVERRAAVPGGEVRHRDAVPAPGVRGVRAQGAAAGRRVPRPTPGLRHRRSIRRSSPSSRIRSIASATRC